MNETIQTLVTRRSIRKYKKEQIADGDLRQVLEAGIYAPSGMGKQPVTIVVIQNSNTIAKLSAMNAKIMGTASDPLYGAPTVLVVLADMKKSANAWSDGCLVMGNLMNAAASLGLGSCWINRAKEEFSSPEGQGLLKTWGLPVHLTGVGHCILGYADEPAPAPAPRKENFIIYDR
ncbi:diguanylate cyclase [Megasphaera cerevisiae DSM 20462]|jgi:nitroreductase|uniref:Diguanylate cyclase n=1 Tax=Megasphaera cerevisiae DSM 20462 TaxID=1122219 RepID=A0A0J6WQT8_9FIRM|nr:nitroreductase family protein [Megasphaera cerevisiae]KMO85805.1 diguanylate cyclase [Megasphaera cerevisiae DSM 20462]OKY52961.1 diguanylate cyclase [Megasphaera cerevisiae]SJZ70866.1 Nitroreductase [Megasphaera cerevisiae DSM 20462]